MHRPSRRRSRLLARMTPRAGSRPTPCCVATLRRLALPLGVTLLLALLAGLGAAPHRAAAAGPVALPAPSPGSVGAGDYDSYAVKSDGTLWSWGGNVDGELGQGDAAPRAIPTQIGTATDWGQVAAAGEVAIALKQDGTMWSWGPNDAYQLGLDSNISSRETPQHVTAAGDDWATVAVGGYFCAALKQDGSLYTWGEDVQGDLGQGGPGSVTTPTAVTGGPYKAIACGRSHLLAIDAAGHLWACGDNNYGELGVGSADAAAHETLTQVGTGTWRSVGASVYSSWAIATDGTLWAWGDNDLGELGDGTTTQRTAPRQIGTATDWTADQRRWRVRLRPATGQVPLGLGRKQLRPGRPDHERPHHRAAPYRHSERLGRGRRGRGASCSRSPSNDLFGVLRLEHLR